MKDKLNDAGSQLADIKAQANDALANARERLPDAETVRHSLENPIGVIIGAAAAGFLAGLLLPVTDIERARLRPIADDLADRAAAARDEIVEQGRAAFAETAAAAQGAVQEHGKELAASLGGTLGKNSAS